jgi:hypothetical protein
MTGARMALVLALAGLLATPALAATPPGAWWDSVCRPGGDSATVTADRGIGGTGIGRHDLVERGIGGTGGPVTRGLPGGGGGAGDTLIVGPLETLPDVCVNGATVALNGRLRLGNDGFDETTLTLRIGDVVAIEARVGADGVRGLALATRHEASGPITALGAGGVLEVAGQSVMPDANASLPAGLHLGDWVAVSGLRDLSGVIHASRLDRIPPGDVMVSGRPRLVGAVWMLGRLRLNLPPGRAPDNSRLQLIGALRGDTLVIDDISDDPVVPPGVTASRLVLRTYVAVRAATARFSGGLSATLGPDFGAAPPADRPVVARLMSDDNGNLIALSWRPAPP